MDLSVKFLGVSLFQTQNPVLLVNVNIASLRKKKTACGILGERELFVAPQSYGLNKPWRGLHAEAFACPVRSGLFRKKKILLDDELYFRKSSSL
jgi:hypothetical protein